MRRYSGQKALYEAMSRSRAKGKRPGMLAGLRPQLEKLRNITAARPKRSGVVAEAVIEKPAPVVLKPPRPVELTATEPQRPARTWLRPKAVQYNDGRIEVSLPYQIGIIIGMGLILVLLMFFWFGRRVGRIDERSRYDKQPVASQADVGGAPARSVTSESETSVPAAPVETSPTPPATAGAPVRTGDNVIVLARHGDRLQLVPVQAYFREHGIETRTLAYARLRAVFEQYGLDVSRLPQGDGYMLVTNGLYENPGREGTNGYAVIQRIKELGRSYKAPQGKESFAPNYFSDAYGMKIAK